MQLLGDHGARRPHLARRTDEFGDLPGRVVRDPEREDLSLGDELGDGREGFRERRGAVGLVQIEEIDAIGAEPLEAALQRGAHPGGGERGVLALVGVGDTGLGGQYDPVATARQQPGEDPFALAARVPVGGVDTGDARVERGVEHGGGAPTVDGVAEGHGAEDEPGQRHGELRQMDAGGHERAPSDAWVTVLGSVVPEPVVPLSAAMLSRWRGFTPRIAVGSRAARRSARV